MFRPIRYIALSDGVVHDAEMGCRSLRSVDLSAGAAVVDEEDRGRRGLTDCPQCMTRKLCRTHLACFWLNERGG